MAMIPGRSVLHGSPGIVKAVARSNRALGKPVNPVHVHCFPLANAVPMNAGPVVFEVVIHDDCDGLSKLSAQ